MFGIGSTELLVILVVALIVLGPKSIPQIAKTLGKAMGEFRRVSTEFQRTMNAEVEQEEHDKRKKEAEQELFGDKAKAASAPAASTATGTAAGTTAASAAASAATVNVQATPAATPTLAAEDTPPPSAAPSGVAYDATTGANIGPDSPLARAIAKAEAEAREAVLAKAAQEAKAAEQATVSQPTVAAPTATGGTRA